jgi:CRP/FNR family transcriptional regulator, anaerobic regulatory protein
MIDKLGALKELPFYDLLTKEEKGEILNNSEIRFFRKGETIGSLSNHPTGPFLILEGSVRAIIDDDNFREITLFTLYPKEIGLLSASCILEYISFDAKFIVEQESIFLVIKSNIIKKIMDENIEVKCVVLETLMDRFSFCMSTVRDLLFTKYDRRIASFLYERYIYTKELEFYITQEEIAKLTSSVREVAGKAIRKLGTEGVLEYSRGRIKILDVEKLKKMI